MRYILIVLMPLIMMADSIEMLYDNVQDSSLYKSKSAAIEAELYNTKVSHSSDGFVVGAGLGFADVRDGSDSGSEFSLSIEKNFNLNSSKVDSFLQRSEMFYTLKSQTVKNRLKVQIWQLYGAYCITNRALQAKANLAFVYDEIRRHIQKGVEFGEFDSGKAIMAKLALENLNLQISKLENAVHSYEAQIKVIVPFDGQFECKDLKPDINKLFDPQYSSLWPMLESNVESQEIGYSLSTQRLEQVNLGVTYSNEIDTDRYMLNLSLPLNYGEKNEAKRAAAIRSLTSAKEELESFRNAYRHETSSLKDRIDTYIKYLVSSEESIQESSDLLIKQSNMRFHAGEESLISMLKATETKLQMIETILELKLNRHNAVAKYMYDYAVDPNGVK